MGQIQILDTGLDKVGGTETYNKVDSGNWIELYGFRLSFTFPVSTTDYSSTTLDNNGDLTFTPNEVSAIISPDITMKAVIPASDTGTINKIVRLSRTQGVKQLAGGLGVVDALPEVSMTTPNYIHVIVKELAMQEVVATDTANIDVTIKMQQVV